MWMVIVKALLQMMVKWGIPKMMKSSGFDDNVGDDSGDGEDNGNVDDDDGLALVIGDKQAVAAQLQGHRQALS